MRQHVHQDQLSALSDTAYDTLLEWEQEKGYTIDNFLEAPTIGQLIEFLSERVPKDSHFELLREKSFNGEWVVNMPNVRTTLSTKEPIDCLWFEVWSILDPDHI